MSQINKTYLKPQVVVYQLYGPLKFPSCGAELGFLYSVFKKLVNKNLVRQNLKFSAMQFVSLEMGTQINLHVSSLFCMKSTEAAQKIYGSFFSFLSSASTKYLIKQSKGLKQQTQEQHIFGFKNDAIYYQHDKEIDTIQNLPRLSAFIQLMHDFEEYQYHYFICVLYDFHSSLHKYKVSATCQHFSSQ